MVRYTLDRMADGGIRDQLGGGFHRYATDPIWLVPHFEQMLYDNAQLARTYLRAWAALGDRRATARSRSGSSTTCSASCAATTARSPPARTPTPTASRARRSPGRPAEIREVLGDDAPLFTAAYGVRDEGNWEGRTILSRLQPAAGDDGVGRRRARGAAGRRPRAPARAPRRRGPSRPATTRRSRPGTGSRSAAFADAARLLPGDRRRSATGRPRSRPPDAILAGLRRAGRPARAIVEGRPVDGEGVLEDYADLADGLLALYEATFDERWFVAARELADTILDRFGDPAGGFFDTADDHEALVTRPKDPQDNATPAGGSMATLVLLRLAALTGEERYRAAAERALATVTPVPRIATRPGFANWLSAAELAVDGIVELAIVGDPADPADRGAARRGPRGRAPGPRDRGESPNRAASALPLLADRIAIDGRPTAYVCRELRVPAAGHRSRRARRPAGRGAPVG